MRPVSAGWLSRFLVGCHPRRWRERYGEEMLDVLDQHRPTARTVLNLAASVLSTHVDPAYRSEALSMPRLRRAALISAAIAVPLTVILGPVGYGIWQDDHWHPAADEGLLSVAFSAHTAIMVTAFGQSIDGTDAVWDVTDLSRPRRLSQFEGGQPTALSPDGRTVAYRTADLDSPGVFTQGLAFSPSGNLLAVLTSHGTVLVYSLADPARPARTATATGLLARAKYPDGQSQPDEVLCASCGFTSEAVAFSPDGHTLTVVVDRTEMSANSGRDTIFDWHVTGSGTLGAVTAAARDVADSQPFIAPGDRTVLGGPGRQPRLARLAAALTCSTGRLPPELALPVGVRAQCVLCRHRPRPGGWARPGWKGGGGC